MSRNLANDILKLILAVMVVGLHANLFVEMSPLANQLLVNGLFRIAVPTFFVINGYYLSGMMTDTKSFLSWAKRIALAYAFWMLVYAPFYFPFHETSLFSALDKLSRYLVFGYYHLWYLCGLLYAVALLYILRNKSEGMLAITAVALFLVGVFIQYYIYYARVSLPYFAYRHFLFFAFPMVAGGYLIRNGYGSTISNERVRFLLLLGCLGLLIEICITYIFRVDSGGFDIYLSFLLICPLLFIVTNRARNTIGHDHLSKLSSAIYFLHPLCFWVARYFFHVTSGTMLFLFAFVVCLIVYYPLSLLSKKLKFIL
jgi:peptidoglycan/LPS O-acetylase OafA/YrhL